MKRTALIVMAITIFSKIFGFAREITLSYFYGASNISDAYLISLTIPTVIFSFIGTGITTGYIPMYSKIAGNFEKEEANIFTNNLVNLLLIICTLLVILGLIFTNEIVKVFASGFEGKTLSLAIYFTRISLFGIYFTGIISIYTGFLQVKGSYFIPAIIALPMNILIIVSIFISKNTNIFVLAIGNVVAIASQLLLLVPFVRKKGYRYKLLFRLRDEHIKTMAYIVWPVIIGVSVNQINVLIDRTMASRIVVGGISALNYANKLNYFVQGLFVLSITTVMYPMISKMVAENNISGLKKSLLEAIGGINLLVIPVSIGAMIFADPIVKLLFGRGAFDSTAISMTSTALFFYSIGMVGFGLREVLSRAFYSMQDTKTPMINAAISMTMNIILNIILSSFMGIGGLALATSISAIFSTGLLFLSLRKKIGAFEKSISITFFKVICASLVMGGIAKLIYIYLIKNIGANLSLVVSIGIGALVYLVLISLMKIEDAEIIVNALKRKINKVF